MGEAMLAEIEAFLRDFGIRPSTFGRRALGDPALLSELRAGRRLWPETAAKLSAFIAAETSKRKAKKP